MNPESITDEVTGLSLGYTLRISPNGWDFHVHEIDCSDVVCLSRHEDVASQQDVQFRVTGDGKVEYRLQPYPEDWTEWRVLT